MSEEINTETPPPKPKSPPIRIELPDKAPVGEASPATSSLMQKMQEKKGQQDFKRFENFVRDTFGTRHKDPASWKQRHIAELAEPDHPDSPELPRIPLNIHTMQSEGRDYFVVHVPPDFDEGRLAAIHIQPGQYHSVETSSWAIPLPLVRKLYDDERVDYLSHLSDPQLAKESRHELEEIIKNIAEQLRASDPALKNLRVTFGHGSDPDDNVLVLSQLPPGHDISHWFTDEDIKQVTRLPLEKVIYIPQDIALPVTPALGRGK